MMGKKSTLFAILSLLSGIGFIPSSFGQSIQGCNAPSLDSIKFSPSASYCGSYFDNFSIGLTSQIPISGEDAELKKVVFYAINPIGEKFELPNKVYDPLISSDTLFTHFTFDDKYYYYLLSYSALRESGYFKEANIPNESNSRIKFACELIYPCDTLLVESDTIGVFFEGYGFFYRVSQNVPAYRAGDSLVIEVDKSSGFFYKPLQLVDERGEIVGTSEPNGVNNNFQYSETKFRGFFSCIASNDPEIYDTLTVRMPQQSCGLDGYYRSEEVNFSVWEQVGPVIVVQPVSNRFYCSGDYIELMVQGLGQNLSYQWYFNGAPIPGATNNRLLLENANSDDNGLYYAIVSDSQARLSVSNEVPIDIITQEELTGTIVFDINGTEFLTGPECIVDYSTRIGLKIYSNFQEYFEIRPLTPSWYLVNSDELIPINDILEYTGYNKTWNASLSQLASKVSQHSSLIGNEVPLQFKIILNEYCPTEVSIISQKFILTHSNISSGVQVERPLWEPYEKYDDVKIFWWGSWSDIEIFRSSPTGNLYFPDSQLTIIPPVDFGGISTLLIRNIQPRDSGNYIVRIAAGDCIMKEFQVHIRVLPAPPLRILNQPTYLERCIGEIYSGLSFDIQGWKIQYQWFKDGSPLPGETNWYLGNPFSPVTDESEGYYQLQLTNPDETILSEPVYLRVIDSPVLLSTTIPLDTTILCNNSHELIDLSVELLDTVLNTSYNWKVNEVIVSASQKPYFNVSESIFNRLFDQPFTISCRVQNPCGSTESPFGIFILRDSSRIVSFESNGISISTTQTRFVKGQTATLQPTVRTFSSAPDEFIWLKDSLVLRETQDSKFLFGSNGILQITNIQPSDAGVYTVWIPDICGGSFTFTLSVEESSAEDLASVGLLPFPSPASTYLSVGGPTTTPEPVTLVLLNTQGKVVFSRTWAASEPFGMVQIDVSQLPSGVYFLQGAVGNRVAQDRILINH